MTTHHTAQGLASLGRHGDTMLVHMSPHEVAGLNFLAKKQGTKLTINPNTGLPEAFSLGGFFSSLLPTIVGAGFGFSSAPLWAGIAAGAATGAVTNRKNPMMGALMGGLGGYGGMGIGSALKNTLAITNPASIASPAAQTAVSGIGPGAIGTTGEIGGANLIGSGIAGGTAGTNAAASNIFGAMKNSGVNIADPLAQDAAKQALQTIPKTSNFSGVNMDPTSSFLKPSVLDQSYGMSTIQPSGTAGGSTLIGEGRNLANSAASAQNPLIAASMSNSPTPGFMDTFVDQLGGNTAAIKKLGLPLGGAVLGGLEPSDIYGNPIKPKEDKYDPYATLNLSGDTGLRLYKQGGEINSYAIGGTVSNPSVGGGLSDLYNRPEGQALENISNDGYGLGRLSQLGGEQARYQAQTLGYAMGGPVSFADGGDTNPITGEIAPVEESMGIASLAPTASTQSMPSQSVQNTATALSGAGDASTTGGSIIEQVTTKLQQDPNYKPQNPIEAAIVKQIKGTDENQQGQQGLASLGPVAPSQPMAPTYTASQPMTPTYYAGMNAPKGYAEGGETSLNLDKLPSLNLETGMQNSGGVGEGVLYSFNDKAAFSPVGKMLLSKMPQSDRAKFIGSGMGSFFGLQERPKQEYYTSSGALTSSYAQGGYLDGQGDGMSDSIPATIEGKQPARLADSEFVLPADVVSHIGNGSSKAGAKRLYKMMDKIRMARTGTKKQGKQINPDKYLPA